MSETTTEEKPKQRAIVLAGERGLEFRTLDEMYRFCVACTASKEFKDIQTPEQALIRLQAGLELGLSPIWSLVNIMVVNGRPSVWGDGAMALIQRHPDCEDVIETNNEAKTEYYCEVKRRGRVPVKREFSVEDAKRAGLWAKSGPWQQYPQRMLRMRARAWALRDSFADALRGFGIVEEMRDIPVERQAKAVEVKPLILPDEIEEPKLKPKRKRRKKSLPVQEPETSNAPISSRSDVTPEQAPISPDSGLGACTENPAKAESDKNPAPSHSGAGSTQEALL
jgi:hypothetical protein